MSGDNSDKTVFKPTPRGGGGNGGGHNGGVENTMMRPMPGGVGGRPQPGGARAGGGAQRSMDPLSAESAFFQVSQGLNPLVNAASSLIAVFEKTRGAMRHPDIGGLHQRLVSEIRTFENRLRDQGFAPEIVLSARYVMCSVLDETVLNTPWGSESAWAQRTLLSVFHNETSGGEKFFLILDRMRQSPAENLNMIELQYLCLSMGFEGKYRLNARGREAIEQIRDELFSTIRRFRGDYDRSLSEHWRGLGRTRNTLAQYIPMWVVVVIVISLLFFGFSGFRWYLYETASPIASDLREINAPIIEAKQQEEKEKAAAELL